MTKKLNKGKRFEHEVAISYAGEDGEIAEQIAQSLRKNGVSVFYDEFYKEDLWGKRLSTWFRKKYGKSSRFVLALVSHYYPVKDWAKGLPSDKAYLDFKKGGLDGVVDCLVQKVKTAASEKIPEQIFREAYEEWKIDRFLPGETKVDYFLENLSEITLNIDTCEFLLRSLTGYYPNLQEKIKEINGDTLFNAAIRLLGKGNKSYTEWRAIRYLVFVNSKEAELYLWNLYKDENEDLNLRVEAFERLWKCESKRGMEESYSIALKEPKWQLRKAAIKNIGYGKVGKETSKVLMGALRDKRWEVRTEAAYAIVRLKLDDLVPNMVNAIKNERSRKGASRLLYCLWNFKNHPSVKELRKKYECPKWFDKTPDYHAIYEEIMDEMLGKSIELSSWRGMLFFA
jgi:hypothetical protein